MRIYSATCCCETRNRGEVDGAEVSRPTIPDARHFVSVSRSERRKYDVGSPNHGTCSFQSEQRVKDEKTAGRKREHGSEVNRRLLYLNKRTGAYILVRRIYSSMKWEMEGKSCAYVAPGG